MVRLSDFSALTWEVANVLFSSTQLLATPSASVLIFMLFVINNVSADCQHGQITADPSNCGNYIQCNHNTQLVRPCPPGLLFNPSVLACDWPSNVQCNGGGGEGSTIEATTPSPSTSTVVTTVSTQTTTLQSSTSSSETASNPPPSPSTSIPPIGSNSHINFAPYFDVNMNGPSLPDVYSKTGQKDFTLAFALGSSEGCKPKWGGTIEIDDPAVINPIRQLQALGGRFIVATGGAMGPYFETLCNSVDELAWAYKRVLDAVGTNHVDVDIESTVDADRMNKALAKVQQERPNTTVSYTLMVQAEDYGLTPQLGVDILKNAKANGVQVTIVNPMCMEFGGPSPDYGDSIIGAANSVLQQMKQIWPEKSPQELRKMLGVTPMIGRNFNGKSFTLEHGRKLVGWANENKIGLLAFWSTGRDNGNCAGGGVSPSCSSIAQSEYEFTKIFQDFKG